jgi:hypothetical protein
MRRSTPAVGIGLCRQLAKRAGDEVRIERLADDPGGGLENLPGLALEALAAAEATAFTVAVPALPVKALALPALTRRARAAPP